MALQGQRLPLPSELSIESTSRGNASSDHCPHTRLGREADRAIALAEARQIVDQRAALHRVVLHGLGDAR